VESPPNDLPSGAPRAWLGLIGVLVLVTGVLWGAQRAAVRGEHTVAGLRVLGSDAGGLDARGLRARVEQASAAFLDAPVAIKLGEVTVRSATRRQLGLRVDEQSLIDRAFRFGRGGDLLGQPSGRFALLGDLVRRQRARRGQVELLPEVTLDRTAAREYLVDLKDDLDRAAVDAHLDLDHHGVAPEVPGTLVKVYDGLIELEYLARAGVDGARAITLKTSLVPARVTAARLAEIDIGTVLGSWETHYSSVGVDSDRTYNLKVGADHLNGHILMPGELFSFNEVVGDRTEKEGYRVAPVIQSGELVDGVAGGMCQIASTLHAAAFFSGLEIVSSTPHSRPSSYIPMGLDSTVVYPTTDLKLRNPYEFPIVMHYNVNQGSVKVELLGKARPVRVVFEREIKGETAFGTETRRDPNAPEGQRFPLQEGYPGYSLVRRRFVFTEGELPKLLAKETVDQALARLKKKPLSRKEWAVHYPTTAQIVAVGSGPKTMRKKDPPPSHHIPALRPEERGVFRITK
jgi:vancomycin resistance protein YoaR